MKRHTWIIAATGILTAALLGAGLGYWYGHHAETSVPESAERESEKVIKPVAKVKVTTLETRKIEETLTVYGTVAAAPGAVQTLSVPYECRVRKVMVISGQRIKSGTDLIEIEPGPDAALELTQALSELETSDKELKLVTQRFEMKLATQQDLIQAEQRHHAAQLLTQSLEARGISRHAALRSAGAGVVTQIDVQKGQIVPPGGALLETVGESQVAVRLGIEDEDKDYLHQGQTVSLLTVNVPQRAAVQGHISLIGRQLNSATRLVDVFVELPPDAKLLLNSPVRAEIGIASASGLVVPRSAVLPVEGDYVAYTVETNQARKHIVHLGLQNDKEVQIIGDGLKEGKQVVIVGNSELEDGMMVEVEPDT